MRSGDKNYAAAIRSNYILKLIAAVVAITGLVTISSVLLAVLHIKRSQIVSADASVTLVVGLSFIYLAGTLARGKRNAWLIALPLYVYLLARNVRHFDFDLSEINHPLRAILFNITLPAVVLAALVINWRLFNVKSEIRSFTTALGRAVIILFVAFLYGSVGFQLVDKKDFHQNIPFWTGAHYTVDQFGLTTNKQLEPQTKQASLFLDSLGAISLGSVFYVVVSLFAPIRFKLNNQQHDYQDMARLLSNYPSTSEDFFKLWPRDKAYFFNQSRSAALAYHTARSIALVVGDPAGKPSEFERLLLDFSNYCRANDWEPALVHTEKTYASLYLRLGFESQKIGDEAIVDIEHFVKNVATNKYFRHIRNKFERQKYACELLTPPHSPALIARLKEISDDWLKIPGRAERGFMMGYFSEDYMQQCPVAIIRDEVGTILAFINQIPSFNEREANFDFLRHSRTSPGNINDFLMQNFISLLHKQGIKKINIGLAPLTGLQQQGINNGAIDTIMIFVYSNGNRFYSFQGLKKFKDKYEPNWESRYIVYRGGLRGFTKTLNALMRAMRLPRRQHLSK